MITKIVERLKTGTVKNVVPYGVASLPAPPSVVVRPEADGLGRGRLFRIIAHFQPGQQTWLEDYIFDEVSDLLTDYKAVSRHGNTNIVRDVEDYIDTVVSNDDGTISMERRFLVPSRLW